MKNNFYPNRQLDVEYVEANAVTKNKTFEETVRAMTSKEIIMAMVESLTPPPTVNVDMSTYGTMTSRNRKLFGIIPIPFTNIKTCYGCAATNTICKIANISPFILLAPENADGFDKKGRYDPGAYQKAANIGSDGRFLASFEQAINELRSGNVTMYNRYASEGEFAKIARPEGSPKLPYLDDDYTQDHLDTFKELADLQ